MDEGEAALIPSWRPPGLSQVVEGDRFSDPNWFGVNINRSGAFEIDLRTATGDQVRDGGNPIPISVPVRAGHRRWLTLTRDTRTNAVHDVV